MKYSKLLYSLFQANVLFIGLSLFSSLLTYAEEPEISKTSLRAIELNLRYKDSTVTIRRNDPVENSPEKINGYMVSTLGAAINGTVCNMRRTTHCRGDCYYEGATYVISDTEVFYSFIAHDIGHSAAIDDYIASKYNSKSGTTVPVLVDENNSVIMEGKASIIAHLRKEYSALMIAAHDFCEHTSRNDPEDFKDCLKSEQGDLRAKLDACKL